MYIQSYKNLRDRIFDIKFPGTIDNIGSNSFRRDRKVAKHADGGK